MIKNYLPFSRKLIGMARSLRWTGITAILLSAAAAPEMLGGHFLDVTALEVEEGDYFPEDPVPMLLTVTDFREDGDPACYEVHVHLTPDVNFRTETDHVLHVLTGVIEPGETILRTWTQMMPGNLPGTFFVDAEVTTCHGSEPSMSSPPSTLASAFIVETAKITLMPSEYPETGLISVTQGDDPSNGNSEDASISDDGRYVAFASEGSTLLGFQRDENGEIITEDDVPVGLIGNTHSDIFVKDHWTGEIERISSPVGASDADGPSYLPRISADGRWVAFHSNARNMVPGITSDHNDVYLADRETGALTRVSLNPDGDQANQASQNASVSGDGRYVVFESEATNLLPNDTNNVADIFLFDREAGEVVRRVNVTDEGVQAMGGESRFPRISADGRHVVFESRARNLTGDPVSGVWEIYVFDRDANDSGQFDEPGGTHTRRLSVSFDQSGAPLFTDGHSRRADLSNDGRYVVFQSESTQLFAEPAEGAIVLPGRAAEAEVSWNENREGIATIGFEPSQLATGSIGFTGNPSDGDAVEIRDGSDSIRFEFDGGSQTLPDVQSGSEPVIIGANETVTRDQLVAAINDVFSDDGEDPTIVAVADDNVNGRIGLRLTNVAFGEPEANQPIDASAAPTLVVEGMSGAQDAANAVQSGDTLEIDHGRTAPVTIVFYNPGEADPTDHDGRILGVEIGRTSKETSLNLLAVFHDLGYRDYDNFLVPELPEELLPPMMENPQHGESFTFTQGDEEEDEETFQQATFTFVDSGPQFDPQNPLNVRIGFTPEITRGNLLRAIFFAGFEFEQLPAIFEGSGQAPAIGNLFGDAAAEGAVVLTTVPEDGNEIIISDGGFSTTFRFEDERDLTEEEEEQGIDEVPPFEVIGGGLVRVYMVEDITVAEMNNRFEDAIQASFLDITARQGFSEELGRFAILLLNNQVGEEGNVLIEIIPGLEEDEDEEPDPDADPNLVESDWALAYGMAGGVSAGPAEGERLVFYPENLLHPTVVFEFRNNLEDLSSEAHFGVQIGETGATTEGNLVGAIHRSGLPWLRADAPDEDLPNVRLRSIISDGDGKIAFNFFASNPDSFACLGDCPGDRDGSFHQPFHGGTLTLRDGQNSPVVFEFTQDGTVSDEEHVRVDIAPVGAITRDNLITAINQEEHLDIRAEDATIVAKDPNDVDELVVRLINENHGPVDMGIASGANLGPFVSVTNIDLGGWNPRPGEAFRIGDGHGTTVTFEFYAEGDFGHRDDIINRGRVPVETVPVADTSDQRAIIRDRIISAIKSTDLQIAAISGNEGNSPAVFLQHLVPGPAGNVPIQTLTPNPSLTVRGMSGGRFLGTGEEQIFLVDRDANGNGIFDQAGNVSIELISISEGGAPGDDLSLEPAISGDGRYVAFRTQATNLQPRTVTRSDGEIFANRSEFFDFESNEIVNFTEVDPFSDIYVRDREEGTNRRVSVTRFGEAFVGRAIRVNAPRSSRGAAINYDGRYIAFETDDEAYNSVHRGGINDANIIGGGMAHTTTNRNPLDFNDHRDIILHDRRFPTDAPNMPGDVTVSLSGIVAGDTVTVGTPVDVEAHVEDLLFGRAVAFVQFYANGRLIGVADQPVIPGGDVFSIRWFPILPGSYQIAAVAVDSSGRPLPISNVKRIEVENVDGIQPTLAIVNPPLEDEPVPDNSFFLTNRSDWPFVAAVGAGGHAVEEVEFFIRNLTPLEIEDNEIFANLGGTSMGFAQPEPSADDSQDFWRLNFDLSNPAFAPDGVPPGYYVVRAVARDSSGNLGVSGPMPIFVAAGVQERPAARLSSNRREFNRFEFTRYRVQAESPHGQIAPGGEVYLFANGLMVDYEDFDNPQEERPFEWEGLALFTGEFDFYAVARDSFGNTSMSNVVRITIHPAGHLFRDPSDKAENTAFVFQIYDDFLEEMPSSAVIRHYVNALERGELTRGEVVVELMSHPDFETIRWVIMTYLTVLGDPPTPDLLRQGIELLEDPEGELPDGGDGVFFDLDREPPLGLPLLVFEILGSDEFWIKHGESGREGQMHTSTLLDIVWKNLGRTWRSNDQKEEERGQLEFMGRPFYLTELVARNYDSLEDRAERAALVILLLDKELDRETLDSYRKFGSIDEFAAWVLTRAEFVTRFGDTQNFVAVESTRDLSREKISWLGTFDDTFFDYAEPAGWIFHTEHGWLYTAGGEDLTGVWFWDHSVQEWLWTRSDHYPLFYRDENQQWIYYRVGSGPDDRQFKFYQEGIGWTSEWQTFPR